MKVITISNIIFQIWAKPKKTSDGIVVIKAMGIIILKNNLNEKEKELIGNLPM